MYNIIIAIHFQPRPLPTPEKCGQKLRNSWQGEGTEMGGQAPRIKRGIKRDSPQDSSF